MKHHFRQFHKLPSQRPEACMLPQSYNEDRESFRSEVRLKESENQSRLSFHLSYVQALPSSTRKHVVQKICPQDNSIIFGLMSWLTKHFSQCTQIGIFHCGLLSECRDELGVERADLDLCVLEPRWVGSCRMDRSDECLEVLNISFVTTFLYLHRRFKVFAFSLCAG